MRNVSLFLLGQLLAALVATAQSPVADPPPAAPPAVPPPPVSRVRPTGGLKAETAALLLSGQEGGNLPLAVLPLTLPMPDGGGQARVPVIVEVDGPALLAGHEEGPLRIEICLYALGAGGGVEASLLDTVEIAPEGFPRLEKSGLKFTGALPLSPGEVSLRVLVRNPATRVLGLKRLALSVPAFRGGTAFLLPPLFPEPGDAWFGARAAEGMSELPEGIATSAARPVLAPEGEVRFQALAYHLGMEARLAVELRRHGGEASTRLPVRLERHPGAGDLETLSATFALHGVDPGDYELRLLTLGAGNPEIRSAPLAVVISSAARSGVVWAALAPTSTAAGAMAGAADSAGRAGERRRHFATAPLEAAFRQALRPLAAGDEIAARQAVAAFETARLVTDRPPLAPADLAEVEARVARDLAKRDPEALVGLLLLYERLYHDVLGQRSYRLSNHDGEIVLGLSELYVRESRASAAKALAAGFLVGLARGQLTGGINSLCRQALARAAAYDEGNEPALLALATDAGRRGDIHTAVDLLEQLLRHHPESVAGRLRLGVELGRSGLGNAGRARRLLGEVAAADPPAEDRWLLSLAYQELSRMELAAGDPGAAEKTLEKGLGRLPGDPALLLQQAALLDRRGEHGRARELLETIQVQSESGETPRHRYNLPPEAAFDRAVAAVEAQATERLPAFAHAAQKAGR